MNKGLQSISLVLICFLERLLEAPNNNGICIVQVPIYMRLLNKNAC